MVSEEEVVVADAREMTLSEAAAAFSLGFEGYFHSMQMDAVRFASHVRRTHIDLAHSVFLRHVDGRFIGLAMLAIRGQRSWCGGFGIAPEFRGQKLGRRLAGALVERARSLKLTSLQLEVISINEKAIRSYKGAGFEYLRDIVSLETGLREWERSPLPLGVSVEFLSVAAGVRREREWESELERPVWARESSVLYDIAHGGSVLVREGETSAALIVYGQDPASGTVHLQRVLFRSEAALTAGLNAIVAVSLNALNTAETTPLIRIHDEPEGSPIERYLRGRGLREAFRQHEMMVTFSEE